jgi:hypothetical protein
MSFVLHPQKHCISQKKKKIEIYKIQKHIYQEGHMPLLGEGKLWILPKVNALLWEVLYTHILMVPP